MLIMLKSNTTENDRTNLIARLEFMGFKAVPTLQCSQPTITVTAGIEKNTRPELFRLLPNVENVSILNQQFKLAGRVTDHSSTIINIKGKLIGGEELTIMAGPCAIESESSIFAIAKIVAENGATILRGGAFKPRTSPYDFQGLGEDGLQFLHAAAKKFNLLTISEVMDITQIELVAKYVDILQIGARNMQNFNLLKAIGKTNKPIMLKRGPAATYNDFLLAAEYILNEGNPNVILCERGIRTFENYTRNTLDIAAVPVLRQLSHLPVIVDPSHGTGQRSLITPLARAAVAAGANGIMIEVHTDPDKALSDAKQTISPDAFHRLVGEIRRIHEAVHSDLK